MEFIITEDYESMSQLACEMVMAVIAAKPQALICFPTGSTPLRMYELLIEANQRKAVDFSQVRVRSVDEYVGLAPEHDQSYAYFLRVNFLDHINVNPANINLIDGSGNKLEEVCQAYQQLIDQEGGIDLYIDGVGANGHIGFNEPAEKMVLNFHKQAVSQDTKLANSRFFTKLDDVPSWALSVGVDNILGAKKAIFLSNGKHKAEAWRRFNAERFVTTEFPLSFLHLASNAVAIIDKASAKYL